MGGQAFSAGNQKALGWPRAKKILSTVLDCSYMYIKLDVSLLDYMTLMFEIYVGSRLLKMKSMTRVSMCIFFACAFDVCAYVPANL